MADSTGTGINPDYLKHYQLLKSIGVWDELEALKKEVQSLEELFAEALEIFDKESIQNLIDFVTSRLLNRFIPHYLIFIIEEQSHALHTLCYRNLRPVEEEVDIGDLQVYKDFFTEYPNPIAFELFEMRLPDPHLVDAVRAYKPEILVPLVGLGGVHGFIIFGEKIVDRGYSQSEISYIHRLMRFTSIGLQNYLHHKGSITDYKTRMYNHSYFMRRLTEETARAKRYEGMLGLLVLDIDFFKKFNDTHGHVAGDVILGEIGDILREQIRDEDVPARFGGEEFVVLLIQCSVEAAWVVAERIRQAVARHEFLYEGKKLHVTVSIGGAHMTHKSRWSANDLLEKADAALYKSKQNGRNRTTFNNPGLYFLAKRARGENT